jgi:hypothetical protein
MSHPRIITATGAIRWNWSILSIFAFFVVATALNIGYTNHVQHQSNQQNRVAIAKSEQVWCDVLVRVIAPDAPPPVTERSWEVYVKLVALMKSYGCPNVPQVPPKPRPTGRSGNPSPAATATRRG